EDTRRPVARRKDDRDRLGCFDRKGEVLRTLDIDVDSEGRFSRLRLFEVNEGDAAQFPARKSRRPRARWRRRQLIAGHDRETEARPPRVDRHRYPARAGVEMMLAAPTVAETKRSWAPRSVISIVVGFGLLAEGRSIVTLNWPSLSLATRL